MKYKIKNIMDNMEESNDYIEITNNHAQIVEQPSDLTISTAMDKYFYPKFMALSNYHKRIEDVYHKINLTMPQKPKRKLVGLRVFLETLLSLGLGCASSFAYDVLSNTFDTIPTLIAAGVSTVVLGTMVGVVDHVVYRKSVKKKNNKAIELNNTLLEIIEFDKKHVDNYVNAVNNFKKQVDLDKQIVLDDIAHIQDTVSMFNQSIYKLIQRVYGSIQNDTLLNLIEKYKDEQNCCKDTKEILNDFETLRRILPTLKVYAPQIIDQDNTNVIYSFRFEEAKLLVKTMIPFAQVLNVTYNKAFENLKEAQRKEEEKIIQEKMRQKEEERKRIEREQEEQRLREELQQKAFQKENEKYKKFFDKYGIEAELDQDELTK